MILADRHVGRGLMNNNRDSKAPSFTSESGKERMRTNSVYK